MGSDDLNKKNRIRCDNLEFFTCDSGNCTWQSGNIKNMEECLNQRQFTIPTASEGKITCDDIFTYNNNQRLLKSTAFELFKSLNQNTEIQKQKLLNNIASLRGEALNLQNAMQDADGKPLFKEVPVPIWCKIAYPLTIRGITNQEEISLALIIKTIFAIFIFAKVISIFLHSLGFVTLLTNIISWWKCFILGLSINKTEESVNKVEKEIKKHRKELENQKKFVKVNYAKDREKIVNRMFGEGNHLFLYFFKYLKHLKKDYLNITEELWSSNSNNSISFVQSYLIHDPKRTQPETQKIYFEHFLIRMIFRNLIQIEKDNSGNIMRIEGKGTVIAFNRFYNFIIQDEDDHNKIKKFGEQYLKKQIDYPEIVKKLIYTLWLTIQNWLLTGNSSFFTYCQTEDSPINKFFKEKFGAKKIMTLNDIMTLDEDFRNVNDNDLCKILLAIFLRDLLPIASKNIEKFIFQIISDEFKINNLNDQIKDFRKSANTDVVKTGRYIREINKNNNIHTIVINTIEKPWSVESDIINLCTDYLDDKFIDGKDTLNQELYNYVEGLIEDDKKPFESPQP